MSYGKDGGRGTRRSVTGLAGTGKTTIAAELIRRLKAEGINPLVMAPTGKAADVLTKKLQKARICTRAYTMHSALCGGVSQALTQVDDALESLTLEMPTNDIRQRIFELKCKRREIIENENLMHFSPKESDDLAGDVLIFDEASMIGTRLFDDMVKHHTLPMIFFGDYGQLPPVNDKQAIDLPNADYKLTKVLRQEAHSGILPLSHFIYNKRQTPPMSSFKAWDDVSTFPQVHPIAMAPFTDTHQAICFENRLRHRINGYIRKRKKLVSLGPDPMKYPFYPSENEELILTTNHNTRGWVNGVRVRVLNLMSKAVDPYSDLICKVRVDYPDEPDRDPEVIPMCFIDLMASYDDCPAVRDPDHERNLLRAQSMLTKRSVCGVQFAHCITGHKSQGSEYEHVFVFSDMSKARSEWAQWNYTAITRARSSVAIAGMV